MAKWVLVLTVVAVCLAVASPVYGTGSSNAAAGGANASAAGQKTTVSAADGGSSSSASSSKNSASASAAVTAAAAAVGNLVTLPSLAVTPATAIVQPVLPAPLQTAFTGVVVDEVVSFSQKYCTAASYMAGQEHPANYTGPGMTISFTTGACTVPFSNADAVGSQSSGSASSSASSGRKLSQASSSGSASGKDSSASANATMAGSGSSGSSPSALSCVEPTLVVTKTPAIYTSAYHSAPTFQGKECKVAPTVGEGTAEILYTFDESAPVDPASLANLIQAKLATILQEGYQDLIKQISSSVTFAPGSNGIAGGSASASAAAGGR